MKYNKRHLAGIVFIGMFFVGCIVNADVIELKDGSVLNGQYKGGTQGTLRFQVNGQVKVLSVKDIMALTFTGEGSSGQPGSKSAVPAQTSPSVSSVSHKAVPAGTTLLVRITEEIGTHNKKVGQRFSGKLEAKLMAGNVQLAPAGATVYGRVLKSKKGGIGSRKAILELTLTEVMIDGQLRPIKTSNLTGEGGAGGLGKKILKGAAIGKMADGNQGAERGAKWGAGIGILAGGKHAGLQAGSVIEFTLTQALSF